MHLAPTANDGIADRLITAALFPTLLIGAYVGFSPLSFPMPPDALASSWRAVLGEAAIRGFKFGEDIIYTGGPLSSLYGRYFQADQFVMYAIFSVIIVVAIALSVTVLASRSRRPWCGYATTFALLLITYPRDCLFLIVPLLTALVGISERRAAVERTSVALGIAATAIVSLAKFSVVPVAAVSFLLVDMVRLSQRRVPIFFLAYAGATFALYSWLERPDSFIAFIVDSWNVSSGYTEAMFIPGPVLELVIFSVIGTLLLLAIAHIEIRAAALRVTAWPEAAARFFVLAVFVFMLLKVGFVRQDGHTQIAWSGLGLAASGYSIAAPNPPRSAMRGLLFPAFACTALLFYVFGPWQFLDFRTASAILERRITAIEDQIVIAGQFIAAPRRQLDIWRREKEEMWARIRAADPLPQLEGSVDVIPSIQSSVIAHGLDYRPRYSFQEFVTYTARLIEANRRSLIERGPRYLLFQPGSIDNRYPAMAEGPLWPDIIRFYEPDAKYRQLLVLRRRARPVETDILGPRTSLNTRIGEVVALPAGETIFLTADIRPTLLGRMADFFLRPSLFLLEVTFATGEHRLYRVIPAIARAGFFVSPFISTADDFLQIMSGNMEFRAPIVTGIAFQTSKFGRLLYQSNIEIGLRPLDSSALR